MQFYMRVIDKIFIYLNVELPKKIYIYNQYWKKQLHQIFVFAKHVS